MNYSEMVFYNGNLQEKEAISPQFFSPGFLLNIGVFETIRVYDGAAFRLDDHLDRLIAGAEFVGLSKVRPKQKFIDQVHELINVNQVPNAYIRITCFKDQGGASDLIVAAPYEGYDPDLYERGMRLRVSSFKKNERSPVCRHKTSSMLENYLAHESAKQSGCDTALLINTQGYVAEAAWANFFCVKSGQLFTPRIEDGALPGITRRAILDLALKLDISAVETSVSLKDVLSADEIFITNSLMEVMPVSSIAGIEEFNGISGRDGIEGLLLDNEIDKEGKFNVPNSCAPEGITEKLRNAYKKALSL